ncbi:MAG TPA: Fe-Mn family superoxide dismutase, partial [Nitrospirota bacterium]|nr:Fe-Mn family superoxide dismutase [Nitrospirota bacterium]
KEYSKLIGMEGFSETLLKNHFTLYQGYVANTNKLADSLAQMLKEGKTTAPEYAELQRRFGWGTLCQDTASGKLFNCWINEHDGGHLVGCNPILILDVFEHAFMIDYALKRADYITAFFKNIDWKAAEGRLK